MRITILAARATACSLMISLAGCGAGGESAPVANPSKLAGYIGTWVGPCDRYALPSLTITDAGVKDTLNVVRKTEYFARFGCAGAILGTNTPGGGAPDTASYAGTIDGAIVFPPSPATTPAKIDLIGVFQPARRASFTGSAVTYQFNAGKPQWCIDFNDGNWVCVLDEGDTPSKPGLQTAFSLSGNTMHVISSGSDNIFSVGMSFTKK